MPFRKGLIDERYYDIRDGGYTTPCWMWTRTTVGERGYGQVVFRGQKMVAHRAVWLERKGSWPEGLQADHLCRNRLCVNPTHIEPVTQSVNSRRSPLVAKLTEEERIEMAELHAEGVAVRALARKYSVTRDTVKRTLKIGGRYGHVPNVSS